MFQIDGRDVLFDWLSRESDSERRLTMLEWLAGWVADPLRSAHRVPGVRAPVYMVLVPLRPPVVIKFLYAEQFHALKLIEMGLLP